MCRRGGGAGTRRSTLRPTGPGLRGIFINPPRRTCTMAVSKSKAPLAGSLHTQPSLYTRAARHGPGGMSAGAVGVALPAPKHGQTCDGSMVPPEKTNFFPRLGSHFGLHLETQSLVCVRSITMQVVEVRPYQI